MRSEISTGDARVFDSLCRARLLLLDDWGAMRETDYSLERMRLVIQHRYDHELATIVTSDRPLREVEPRLASRMGTRGSSGQSAIVQIRSDVDLRTGRK
jgi:DNA replication protein DnaC